MKKIFLRHRVNSIKDLKTLERNWGVEIDLRSSVTCAGKLHLAHDPWTPGDDFEAWLVEFKKLHIQGPIWLNTKEDGLEDRVEELLQKHNLEEYCFLDTVLPTLVKMTQFQEKRNFAIRLSAYEPKAFVDCFKGRANWVWVDCFQGKALSIDKVLPLKDHFKICLVSPELHGFSLKERLADFQDLYQIADAVCSKDPNLWMSCHL